jgi:hypothetical protein
MSGYDIEGARKAGYSDDAIAKDISDFNNIDYTAAIKGGHTNESIIKSLSVNTADRIPGSIPQPTPTKTSFLRGDPNKSILSNIAHAGADIGSLALEVPATLLSGTAAGIIAPISGLVTRATGGDMYQANEAVRDALQRYTYQPRNEMGQQAVSAIGETLAPLGGVPIPTMTALGRTAPAAVNQLAARATTAAPASAVNAIVANFVHLVASDAPVLEVT